MVQSLEQSLCRLRTDYVDVLWLHMWDGTTPVEEVMRAFDDLVRSGKVLHAGFSDTPSWVVSRAAAIAELRGWTRPCAVQAPYSLSDRSVERDLLPMAAAHDLPLLAWGVLGGGVITGKYGREDGTPCRYGDLRPRERTVRIVEAVAAVAEQCGMTPAQVALAWMRAPQRRMRVIPLIGARTTAQLRDNLRVLDLDLPDDAVQRLDDAATIDLGFPQSFLRAGDVSSLIFGTTRELLDV
jgi:aryl-alcohol dehydrogenase-like predicted oxidoreductase